MHEPVNPAAAGAHDDELVVAFLQTHDAWCEQCGYGLRGLAEPRCPECGVGLAVRVGSARPRLGPWLLAIVSFSLGAGFDLVLSLIGWAAFLAKGPPPPARPFFAGVLAAFTALGLICLTAVVGLGVMRARWFRLTVRRQRATAAVIFVGVGLAHAAWGLWLTRIL